MQRGLWEMAAIGVATLVVFVAAVLWPAHRLVIGLVCVLVVAGVIFFELRELRKPVNYKSLSVARTHLEYVDSANTVHVIAFRQMTRIEFIREEAMFPCLDGPYLETKWMIHTSGGARVEVMDEWPHRRKLLHAFGTYLAAFDSTTASAALGSRQEGNWLCFQSGGTIA